MLRYFTILMIYLSCYSIHAEVAKPTDCPFHHGQLIKVPVVYGLIEITPEVQKDIDNLKFVCGGCAFVDGISEKEQLICEKCKYHWENRMRCWERKSDDPEAFFKKFESILKDWSFPNKDTELTSKIGYYQYIENDGSVKSEETVYWQKTKPSFDMLTEFLEKKGYIIQHKTSIGTADVIEASNQEWSVKVNAKQYERKKNEFFVQVTFTKRIPLKKDDSTKSDQPLKPLDEKK